MFVRMSSPLRSSHELVAHRFDGLTQALHHENRPLLEAFPRMGRCTLRSNGHPGGEEGSGSKPIRLWQGRRGGRDVIQEQEIYS